MATGGMASCGEKRQPGERGRYFLPGPQSCASLNPMGTTTLERGIPVANTSVDRRADFIVRTYNTLFVSIAAFAGIEVALFKSGLAQPIAQTLSGSWMLVLGGFMLVSWFASHVAMTSRSTAATYGALAFFVVVEAIIFVPLLFIADRTAPGTISSAAIVTMVGFAALTGVVWTTKKDFSFLGSFLRWIGIMALVLIGAAWVFDFALGSFFSVAMVVFAGASILYETSNILCHYPEDRHAAAALALFSSVALMFWYILRLFISSRD